VQLTTVATYPEPYSQPVDPSRTRQGPARKTGDSGVSLAGDFERSARLLALVLQKAPERPPAGIQHGFGHPCPDELQATHVTDDDFLKLTYDFPRELVQGIGPAAGDLAMNALGLALVASALRGGELSSVVSGPSPGRQAIPVARDRDIL
jgi:hypothetical protein